MSRETLSTGNTESGQILRDLTGLLCAYVFLYRRKKETLICALIKSSFRNRAKSSRCLFKTYESGAEKCSKMDKNHSFDLILLSNCTIVSLVL